MREHRGGGQPRRAKESIGRRTITRVRALWLSALVALAAGTSTAAQAQMARFLTVGAGATFPIWEYDRLTDPGWVAELGAGRTFGAGPFFGMVTLAVGSNINNFAQALHPNDGSMTLRSAGLHLGATTRGHRVRLYGYLGGGLQHQRYRPPDAESGPGDTKIFGNAWAGLSFGRGAIEPWVQGGIAGAPGERGDKTSYLGVMAGIRLGR